MGNYMFTGMIDLLRELVKFLLSKEYVVGDDLPKHLKFSKLDSIGVYRAKRLLKIVNILSGNRLINEQKN